MVPANGFVPPPAPRRRRGRALRALDHPEFRTVWGTLLIGQLGFWIAFLSFQALMARLTDTSGTWLGALFFFHFIPMLLFTPVAGVVADRVERRRILVAGHLAVGALALALAVLALTGSLTPAAMLPFAFALGTAFSFTAPASHAVVANAVPPFDLPSAVSLQSVGTNLSRVVGPALAAPLLALWNEGAAFAIYAGASLAVALLLRRVRLSPLVPEQGTGGFWARLRGGFDHARERPPALLALSVLCLSSLFAGAYLALLPLMATEAFDRGETGLTVLAAVTGAGSVLGALSSGFRVSTPSLRSAALLVAGFGASLAAFGLMPTWWWGLVAAVPVGAFYFSGMTTLTTLLQTLADDAKRGRLMSLFVIGWAGLVPIGGLWQGMVASAHGVRVAVVLAGAVTAVYGVAIGLSQTLSARR